MRLARYAAVVAFALSCAGCWSPFQNPFSNPFSGGSDDRPEVTPSRVTQPSKKYAVAVGGVMPGRDEIVIFDTSGNPRDFGTSTLTCTPDDSIIKLAARTGYDTEAAGSGVKVTAVSPGVTAVRCKLDSNDMSEVYEVTVPPQSLIQILVAEAGQQLSEEAKIDEDAGADVVALDSSSPTAEALGSVIRNRIELINQKDRPALFNANPDDYDADPPASYYDAVIMAQGQFSPTAAADSSNDIFMEAERRAWLSGDERVAYDQAVITAAGIFNGDIADTAGSSFAFRTPTDDEWAAISQAFAVAAVNMPANAGFSDASFPDLDPIQILVLQDVWKYDDGRPAFVFARSRPENSYAVVNVP